MRHSATSWRLRWPVWVAALGACAALASAGEQSARAAVEPVYWRQRVFFIPYQGPSAAADKQAKVELLLLRDGATQWTVLQQAEANVRGFSYHAPADGAYAFALRVGDELTAMSPGAMVAPQLRVFVDTQPPQLAIQAQLDPSGAIVIRYEAQDAALKSETLRLEAETDGKTWQPIPLGPPSVSQPGKLAGQLSWKAPGATSNVRFRATIEDRAGNQASSGSLASLVSPTLAPAAGAATPLLDGPSLLMPNGEGAGGAAPTTAASPFDVAGPGFASINPPAGDASAASGRAPATVAQMVADGGAPFSALPPIPPLARAASPSADTVPPVQSPYSSPPGAPPSAAPSLFDAPPLAAEPPLPSGSAAAPAASPGPSPSPLASSNIGEANWGSLPATNAAAENADPAEIRWINSLTFDVDYVLQAVGPWGVSKVELWATRDHGQHWANYGPDPDNRGPMRVTMPSAGVYGFRIIVSGANGATVPTPRSGDQPELTIGVDLQPPQAELQAAQIGQGELADHLVIRWTASDENLDARPVGLFFSGQPDGPWSMIASDLDNNGQYAWRLLRQVPEQLYLRLEVRDKAGNVTARQSAAPVSLNLPQPTGQFRNVRPVTEDTTRYRTANGAR